MLNVRVVKIGGNELDRPDWLAACGRALKPLEPVVVVHGGGRAVSALSQRLDLPVEKRDGVRVTTPAVAEAVEMELAGVRAALLMSLLLAGFTPVIAPMAPGSEGGRGGLPFNANATPRPPRSP